jgi:Asp-tRNA(Asn)/Glu-tRNA(Gln) amidotransferase A subunit family amidase
MTMTGGPLKSTIGPVCKTIDDVVYMMKIFFHPQMSRFDPYVPPLPFKNGLYDSSRVGGLRIGYCESLVTAPASEPCKRAVRMAKEALEKKGYTLVKIDFTRDELVTSGNIMTGIVGNFSVLPTYKVLESNYESVIPIYEKQRGMLMSSSFFRFMIRSILKLTGNKRIL